MLTIIAIAAFGIGFINCAVKFDEQYLRLQGYQITSVLEAKSSEPCWKTAFENLTTDCRGHDDRQVIWVRVKQYLF